MYEEKKLKKTPCSAMFSKTVSGMTLNIANGSTILLCTSDTLLTLQHLTMTLSRQMFMVRWIFEPYDGLFHHTLVVSASSASVVLRDKTSRVIGFCTLFNR